jgi:hypothetical protein
MIRSGGFEALVGEVNVRLKQVCRPVRVDAQSALDAFPHALLALERVAVGSRRDGTNVALPPGNDPAPFRPGFVARSPPAPRRSPRAGRRRGTSLRASRASCSCRPRPCRDRRQWRAGVCLVVRRFEPILHRECLFVGHGGLLTVDVPVSASRPGSGVGRANQVKTTILPPARFSSMQRCASTMSSSLKTRPTWTRSVPAVTCSANSSSGVSMKSSGPPS